MNNAIFCSCAALHIEFDRAPGLCSPSQVGCVVYAHGYHGKLPWGDGGVQSFRRAIKKTQRCGDGNVQILRMRELNVRWRYPILHDDALFDEGGNREDLALDLVSKPFIDAGRGQAVVRT